MNVLEVHLRGGQTVAVFTEDPYHNLEVESFQTYITRLVVDTLRLTDRYVFINYKDVSAIEDRGPE